MAGTHPQAGPGRALTPSPGFAHRRQRGGSAAVTGGTRSRPAAPARPCSDGTSPSGSTARARSGSRRPRRRRTGTAGPSRRPPSAPRCTPPPGPAPARRRAVAAASSASASPSIDGQMPELPDLLAQRVGPRPATTAASGPARSTRTPGSSGSAPRSVPQRVLERRRGSRPPSVIAGTESRQASLAPTITVTSSGFCARRLRHLAGQVGHPGPGHRVVPAALRPPGAPEQPYGEAVDLGRVPVAQDTSGQSDSTEQASKPRVMESPTAAMEAGLLSQAGVRRRRTARPAPACRPAPGESPPTASQPATPSTAAAAAASDGPRTVTRSASAGSPSVVAQRLRP